MCGIAGYVGKRDLSQQQLNSCLGLMNHRGPDAQGCSSFEISNGKKLFLLHSRTEHLSY